MSNRVRNSEFRRDVKEEILPPADGRERDYWPGKDRHSTFRGGNPSKWSELEANNASKPADCSRWSTRESSPGDSNVKMDETINDVRHKLPIDTAFHGRGRLHNTRPFDDSLSQPLSGRARGNIQNRSRDRDGSRSRSRSRSPSWNRNQNRSRSRSRSRGRVKARGMGRSRSRSRSRSWDRGGGGGGGRGRSRSPYFDERHQPFESADRLSGPRLSSRVCRDFAMGHCRRGNQCRFLHQEGVNSEGGKRSNDIAERSSIRPEYGGSSRYSDNRTSADRPRDKASDRSRRYNGEEEPVRDSIICCKEFLKGRCRWGASCRYPHHVTSGDNYNKSNRNDSYGHDSKVPPNRSGKVPCKYFLSGKCHREDCKFSHDAPTSGGYDARSRDDRLNQKVDEKSKPWNGPTWDEATPGLSNNAQHSGRSDNYFQNLNSRDSAANEKSADVMSRSWNGPTWDDVSASNLSQIAKPTGQRDSSIQKLNAHDSAANENHDDKNKSWNGSTWDEVAAPDLSDMAKSSVQGNISPRNLNLCDSASTGKYIDRKKSWNGPRWDESSAPGLSDINKSVEWGDRSVGNLQSHDPVTIEQQSGSRGDHGRENQRDGPPWNDKTAEGNEYFSSNQQGGSNDRYMGALESKGTKNFVGNEDAQLVFDGSRSQPLGGICMPTNERNIMLDASGRELASIVLQPQASEVSRIQQLNRLEQDNPTTFDDSNVLDVEMVSEETTYSALAPRQVFNQSGHSMGIQHPSNLGGFEQNWHTHSLNPSNGPNVDLSGSAQDLLPLLDQQNQTQIYQNEAGETQKVLDIGVPQVMPEHCETVLSSKQVSITDLPAILTQISQNGQLPQLFAALNPNDAKALMQSLPTSASLIPPVNPMVILPNLDMKLKEQYDQARESMETRKPDSNYEPPGFLSSSIGNENEVPSERFSLLSTSVPSSTNLHASSASGEEHHKSLKSKQHESDAKGAANDKNVAEKHKLEQGNIQSGNADARGNIEEGNTSNDEKAMRLFKIALVEFVKEILKPTWKEGRLSREVHKTVVKKVVNKVTSTLQGNQIPKTQEKIEHYLAFSKSKITKLVEAYVERSSKPADA